MSKFANARFAGELFGGVVRNISHRESEVEKERFARRMLLLHEGNGPVGQDVHPTGEAPQRLGGLPRRSLPWPIHALQHRDGPHQDLKVATYFLWVLDPALDEVKKCVESLKKYRNPPAPTMTKFQFAKPTG